MKSYIVIGAGILGASTAYHLAKEGAKVTIIDREDEGQATDAAAGIVCPWLSQRRNKVWYRLAKGGAKYYPELIEGLTSEGETETGYKKVGAISLHTDEKKLDKMIERALERREDAPEIGEIKKLTTEETKAMFPPLSDEYQSVHVSGAARINGSALRKALLRVAKKNGAEIRTGEAELVHSESEVTGVNLAGEQIKADKVIVTAGAWANELFEPLGLEFHVSSQKAQIVHLDVQEDTSEWPVVMPPNDQYLLSFDDGRVVVGATHENDVGFDKRVTAGGLHEIFSKALEVAPGLANSTMVETKVGFRPFTPGFLPVFGEVPGTSRLLAANGLGASGLTVGPYLGLELARMAMGEETELSPLDYDLSEAIKKVE
ncbi:NAD(P)/FAD-dependent oxidoreductase [Guptibacillus algicola]|uniref:NAD(P)/FAD-dependent oxidoreductase n=1 Tax=Guptibacillus algicola TaxID=225844 RepID=UPI001CD4C4A3|nr:FAD-binding oxidoreductase [Alkalihalobacillus algicola]MCA0985666.1 FAD-binding oxidoreductase [Alkalihalobacillus algicola]